MGMFGHKLSKLDKATLKARMTNVVLGASIGLLLAGGIVSWQLSKDEARTQVMQQQALHPQPINIGGAFTLKDQDGKVFTDADLRGKYSLVYFGYTFCPDMCPTGLQSMSRATEQLGADADKLNLVFITIDPARDTPAKLKEYVGPFGAKIHALSGTPEQTAQVAKAYQIYYAKVESEDGPQNYEMDHSSLIYLMNPEGKFVASFPEEVDAKVLADSMHDALAGKPVATVPDENDTPGSPEE